MEEEVRYPNITVKLTEKDGDALSILGTMKRALRKNGVSEEEMDKFQEEALSGNYDNLLITCMKWVNVE